LRKQADSATGLYGVLLQKLNETNIAASLQNNNVRLLDRAVVPSSPVWPQKRRIDVVSMLAGLLLGAGWVLLRDALDNTIKDAEDVERHLHIEMLASIPRYTKDTVALATEAYHNLRTALLFSRRGDGGQVVLVTSTAPGEGKTTTLLNMAKLFAASGESTVVVDCDLRRANLHLRLDVPREPGFTDFFLRKVDLAGLVRPARQGNLSVVASGALPPNPPALLARPELESALDQLRRHFRWVLVDSPPVAAVTDALFLAHVADAVLLVVQQNLVDRKEIKRALALLRKITTNVIGAVLNAVEIRSKGYYGYHYGTAEDQKAAKRGDPASKMQPGTSATAPEVGDAPTQ
jgi:capsular exopolysaccharide synthesis family protein